MISPKSLVACLLAASVIFAGGEKGFAGTISEARLRAAADDKDNWIIPGRDYANQRFSPLDKITPANVGKLVPKWIYQTGIAGTFQTTPLVADGVMYVTTPFSNVVALNAVTGREIWRYDHKVASGYKLCCGPANRGAALGQDRVFVATVDARLVALESASGQVAWDIPLVDPDTSHPAGMSEDKSSSLDSGDPRLKSNVQGQTGVGSAAPPLVVGDLVIAGINGVGYGLHLDSNRPGSPLGTVVGVAGRFGRPGFIAAFDVKTGKRVWQFDTTEPGWEGEYSPTTPDGIPLHRDIAGEKAAAPKFSDSWRHGGGSSWPTPAYDPALGLIYIGVGNPSPQASGETRPGDNLYTVCLVALDVHTGKRVWHYQLVPHDVWGYDVASPPVLFDATVDGKPVPAIGHASKLGWYYTLDRRDGRLLFKSEPFVPQQNLFAQATKEGVLIAPGVGGGTNWSPTSFDATSGIAYVAAMHMPSLYKKGTIPATSDRPAVDFATIEPADVPYWGTLTAIDVAKTGKILWQRKTSEPLIGGVLATAGGLVFTGEGSGEFSAFDAKTGDHLWSFNCGAGVNAPPIAFQIDGREYIAVAAGGSQIWGFRQGDAVVVFALSN
ncbi:pyrroloquinoline quinone-dependent dehydrogenase [Hyphomicrobium facile]|uniref:PQQ-dependent dehydrogenase, methanol/ethanol family n=1 Tax=Hyphomicrobium facile TaxID=51670 RepID=A0A1I7MXD9_9HYPH|nr:PQQ-binding-like beta-propeller repeat protein [Hyphomicrobium facile]SFV27038.1 PQQ-dependent dehydrogenase, methanol/ethanol family [Hyphomicrobium facile]